MNPWFVIKGFLVGFSIAAPVGPTTVLVIHRTIKQSYKSGLLSGFGAATADATFALVAAFGVGLIAGFIHRHTELIRAVGGCFLIFWGVRIFLSKFAELHPLVKGEGWGGPFFSTLVLTFTNPMTLLAFMAILAGLGDARISRHFLDIIFWIVGICAGSFGWWWLLSRLAYGFRDKFNFKVLTFLNRLMGAVVTAAGAIVLLSVK